VTRLRFLCCALLCLALPASGADGSAARFEVPAWLFPVPAPAVAPATSATAPADPHVLRVPGSDMAYTQAEARDYFAAPDWHPGAHPPMPEVVAHGRRPDLYACGFCHLPDGAGRPENATLAGLPAGYIVDQVAAFASGARRSAWNGPTYLPTELMAKSAALVSRAEIADAAAYFSSLRLQKPRAEVIETDRVPRTRLVAWIYARDEGAGDEPLGQRLLEMPRDFERHELRDSRAEYVAYVPRGSLARGRKLAMEGTAAAPPCAACHGPDLRGLDLGPPLAGRSPTYLLRQLIAFRTGARHTREGAPMKPVVDRLTLDEMIAVAAYVGALEP
jgi:cytochrome c553